MIKRMLGLVGVAAVVLVALTGCAHDVNADVRDDMSKIIALFEEQTAKYTKASRATDELWQQLIGEGVGLDLAASDETQYTGTTSTPVLIDKIHDGPVLTVQIIVTEYGYIGGGYFSQEARLHTCGEYTMNVDTGKIKAKGIECPDAITDRIDPTSEFVPLDDLREGD